MSTHARHDDVAKLLEGKTVTKIRSTTVSLEVSLDDGTMLLFRGEFEVRAYEDPHSVISTRSFGFGTDRPHPSDNAL